MGAGGENDAVWAAERTGPLLVVAGVAGDARAGQAGVDGQAGAGQRCLGAPGRCHSVQGRLGFAPVASAAESVHAPSSLCRRPVLERALVKRSDRPDLTIVLPMFNEEDLAADSVSSAAAAAARLMDAGRLDSFEIVAVDDGSTDATPAVLQALATACPELRVVTHPRNGGLGAAVRSGLGASRGSFVLYTDADLPCDLAAALPRAFDALDGGADMVAGYRLDRAGEGVKRYVYSAVWNALVRHSLSMHVRDVNFAFKLMRRCVIDDLVLTSNGSFIDAEMLTETIAAGHRVEQIGIEYHPRERGESTLSSRSVVATMTGELVDGYRLKRLRGRAAGSGPLVVVNADDFGLTPGVCGGIIRGHTCGLITSTSVLANAPAFDEGAAMLRDTPTLEAGVHLACVGEDPPLLGASEIPTLVTADGSFRSGWRALLADLARGRVDADDLHREFSAQIAAVQAAGITVGHLNTHQHVHLWPTVAAVVLRLAAEHDVPVVRVPRHAPIRGAAVNVLSARLGRTVTSAGLVGPRYVSGMANAGNVHRRALKVAMYAASRSPEPVVEIATHPGEAEDPDRDRYAWGYRWADELDALCDPAMRALASRLGLRLGSYRDLRPDPPA